MGEPDTSPSPHKPGIRIGPMVFVPEWSAKSNDPWAKRKAEPRTIALGWCIFIMASTAGTVLQTHTLGMAMLAPYQRAAGQLILLILTGSCILWPMVRLSQSKAYAAPLRATLTDLSVAAFPMQAVIWPLPLITGWGWMFMLGVVTLACAWTFCCMAWAHVMGGAGASGGRRSAAMLMLLCVVGVPALVEFVARWRGGGGSAVVAAFSPLSMFQHMAHPPSGLAAHMGAAGWASAASAAVAGTLLLVVRGLWGSGTAPRAPASAGYTPALPDGA